jgi:hypothetical protein
MFLPALSAASAAEVRLDRHIAMLRVVEAVRLFAAKPPKTLPRNLAEIAEVPIPADPVSNQPFQYRLDGSTAILSPAKLGELHTDLELKITLRP